MWFIISTWRPNILFSVPETLVFLVFLSVVATIHCKEPSISRLISMCGHSKGTLHWPSMIEAWCGECRVRGWFPVPTFPSWFEISKRKFYTGRHTSGFTYKNTFWCSYLPSFVDKQTFCLVLLQSFIKLRPRASHCILILAFYNDTINFWAAH